MTGKTSNPARILPRGAIGGPALFVVMTTMCFLACLALGSALLVDHAAAQWLKQASNAATVQIIEHSTQTAKEQIKPVMKILKRTPGIKAVREVSQQDLIAMLEPWLGQGNVTDDLPLPLMIEIDLAADKKLNQKALMIELKAIAPGAQLDTHGRWRNNLERGATLLRFLSGLILLLVLSATGTVLVFATRSALVATREILDVLHLVGATDNFIARQFSVHLLRQSLWACGLGFIVAISIFYIGANASGFNLPKHLLPTLMTVPIINVFFCWFITRHYVLRTLQESV